MNKVVIGCGDGFSRIDCILGAEQALTRIVEQRPTSIRILFLALDVDTGLNRGDSVHVRKVAASLAKLGHTVHLVVGLSESILPIPGVEVTSLPQGGDLQTLRFVTRLARKVKAEVIYERRFSLKISAAAGVLLGIPFVGEFNGIPEEEVAMLGRQLERGIRGRLRRRVRLWTLRRARAMVAVTPGIGSALVSSYRIKSERVFIVPNGVDAALFQPLDKQAMRATLGFGPGLYVCFVGNLVEWQGLNTLIQAIPRTREIQVLIVGSGPQEGLLRAQAHDLGVDARVLFLGEVPHDRVPDFIAASDVCVAPKRRLSSGYSALKINEYLACARPVVVSAVPGAYELVRDLGCGMVVPPDDPDSLARALEIVLSNLEFEEAAKRASVLVRNEHSWDETAKGVIGALESALHNRPR